MKNSNKKFLIFLGQKIRKEREKKGLSQEEFGEKVGVHRTYVGMVERGEKNITLNNIIKFAHSLNLQVKDLIDF
jgi:transcriptional regulator with XRE-family HTH domain